MPDYLKTSYVHSKAKHAEYFSFEINGLDFAPLTPPKNETVLRPYVSRKGNIELPEHGGIEDRRVPAGNVEEVLVVKLDKEDPISG